MSIAEVQNRYGVCEVAEKQQQARKVLEQVADILLEGRRKLLWSTQTAGGFSTTKLKVDGLDVAVGNKAGSPAVSISIRLFGRFGMGWVYNLQTRRVLSERSGWLFRGLPSVQPPTWTDIEWNC